MTPELILLVLKGWLIVFVPLGLLGLVMWVLWRLIPRFRRTSGYGANRHGRHQIR